MAFPTPLTTTFTPAPDCLSEIHWGTDSPWYQLGPGTQCIPPGPNPSVSSFYSPGLYCPQGYTVACSTEVLNGAATETRATCCPEATALGSLSGASFACQVNTLFFATSYGCALGLGPFTADPLTVVATNGSTFQSTFSVGNLDAVNAFSVQIRWQESDLATTTSDSSVPITTSDRTATDSTASATSAYATPTATMALSSNGSDGLSTGAKVAIGVIVPVVVIAALIAGFFLLRRRKRAQPTAKADQTFRSEADSYQDTEVAKPTPVPTQMPSELDGSPILEAGSSSKVAVEKG